ncbi:MAG: hypothetical protein P4L99_20860 [Chthoniobacter sp.]|nr:hypothetical protein [Chthoniobacter sp.]
MSATAPSSSPSAESGLAAFRAHELFPGRTALRIGDVAEALSISEQQVLDLIEEFRDTAGASGLGALNIRCGLSDLKQNSTRPRTVRSQWRIPVAAFDAFINARMNNQPVAPRAGQRAEPGTGKAANKRKLETRNPKAS